MTFLYPLAGTLLIEMILAYILGIRSKHTFLIIFLVNCVTNPLLTVCISLLPVYGFMRNIIIYGVFEPVVVLSEYLIYRYDLEEEIPPFRLSLLLNLASLLGGFIWLNLF